MLNKVIAMPIIEDRRLIQHILSKLMSVSTSQQNIKFHLYAISKLFRFSFNFKNFGSVLFLNIELYDCEIKNSIVIIH